MATVIVLNGASSSGKTTLARAFQDIAGSLYLNFSIDDILYSLPQSTIDRLIAGHPTPEVKFADLVTAYYACVRELAALGHNLVIDNAITARYQAERLVQALTGHDVLMVLVTCPEPTLRTRESARRDRRPGLASDQLPTITRWLHYDLTVDTFQHRAVDAARAIVDVLAAGLRGGFERTRQELSDDDD